jgi:multicomponent K+:H+ antiporter subunit E
MMHRLLPHPILSLALAAIWLLLVNSASAGQILLGLLLGWGIPLFTRHFWPDPVRVHRPLALVRFIGVVLYDILMANLTVAGLVLGHPQRLRPAFVVLPLRLKSELAISLLANTICLTPGTVSARLSADRTELLVHVLDAADPQAVVAEIRARYEAPLLEVFESC